MNQEPQRTVRRKRNQPSQAGLQNCYQVETSTGFLLFKSPAVVCWVWAGVWIRLPLVGTSSGDFFKAPTQGSGNCAQQIHTWVRDKTLDLMSALETVTVSLSGGVKGGECVLHARET